MVVIIIRDTYLQDHLTAREGKEERMGSVGKE